MPASDIITIRFELASGSNYQLLITDIAGRQVMPLMESATTEDNEQLISLDVHELPAGVYAVFMQSDGVQQTAKFVVQH